MGRPRQGYGKGIVGVTTVLSQWGKNKGALMHWAWQLGMEGQNYREVRDDAANAGSLAHLLIEHELKGKPAPDTSQYPPDVVEKAEAAYLNWLDWAKLSNFKVLETELSLVDEDLGFGGTMDLVSVKGKPALTDWKTSKGGVAYKEMWCQLAAYGHLWHRAEREELAGGYYLLLMDKMEAGFSYHHKVNLEKYWEIFYHLLMVYKLDKETG